MNEGGRGVRGMLQVLYTYNNWRILLKRNYLFITYIVTSKPKRISVAAGFVHIIISNIMTVNPVNVYFIAFYIHVIVYMYTFCAFLNISQYGKPLKNPAEAGLNSEKDEFN